MKKMAFVLAASTLAAAMLTGCGSKGIEVDVENLPTYEELSTKEYGEDAYVKNLDIANMVTLGEYKGLELTVEKVSVDEAEVEDYISGQVEANPFEIEITDRAVEDGDTVNINYIGLMRESGYQFDGGTANNQELVIGSDSYIDGFEDGLIGLKTGEVAHLELTFPADYPNTELAGADVVFTVTLNKIYSEEPAELSDEWVQTMEIEGVSTVDEYRDYVYNMYLESDQDRYNNELKSAALKAVVENTEFKGDYTDVWQRYFNSSLANVLYQTSYYGFDLETFAMLYGGMSVEEFVDELVTSSEGGVKETLATQAVALAEGMEVDQEVIDAKMAEYAEYYGYTVEEYTSMIGDVSDNDEFKELIMSEMVMDFLVDNAVITETEPVAETEAETETEAAE